MGLSASRLAYVEIAGRLALVIGFGTGRFCWLSLVLALTTLVGCRSEPETLGSEQGAFTKPEPARLHQDPVSEVAGSVSAEDSSESTQCGELWDAVQQRPALPGAPEFEKQRAVMLARAKAEPVLFLKPPQQRAASSATVESYRKHLNSATRHWDVLSFELGRFLARPDIGREVLLRDGYLIAKHPHMAYAMDQQVRPEHLFDAQRIWIQRGERVYWATRVRDGTYVYEQAQNQDPQRVGLLHLDRLGVGKPPAALHVDVRALRNRLHFDRLEVERLTSEYLLTRLWYGQIGVRSILRVEDAHLELQCEIPDKQRPELAQLRERAAVRAAAVLSLQQVMHDQVVEALPFDEPRAEQGNQDGMLRQRWLKAYLKGRNSFRFDDVDYEVFNHLGRPRPPQVCVDFLTDTLERASGRWFAPKGQQRGRIGQGLDLSKFESIRARRVTALIDFAEQRPDWFELYAPKPNERIPLGRRDRFFNQLAQEPVRYAVGDILIVHGHTREDRERAHYHSFYVYETDPISGVPIAVVGNAGYPHIWSLESESRRAPSRAVWYRLRPRLSLLQHMQGVKSEDVTPVPLVEEAI